MVGLFGFWRSHAGDYRLVLIRYVRYWPLGTPHAEPPAPNVNLTNGSNFSIGVWREAGATDPLLRADRAGDAAEEVAS